ncbi:hypothetical protein B7R78_0006205 [Ralstonia solanacearum]|uniref:Lipoprotein n=1 Tax=Ralstonia solanacearum K60 TaxID=1091042 RepID=A0AAP7ZMQ6_RALSL|nr:hypothetical protein [Ralstonia solanacearum]MBT1536568.1 hypothetical protein [Ralstonia solanacearum]MBT1536725.1 hypothetical protein [Ralstonia solanacearum]OYQ13184.1 hypothetical protein B7R77_07940 [Ralstonia solanacearum K60]QOK83541.1 hypothetical protein HF906_16110 [Ralstonia solanacearum]RIJ86948.1 hypothetical protein RSP822_07200 [Ralstonia solanacearum]
MQNKNSNHWGGAFLRGALLASVLTGAALLSGCASVYVDTATREVPAADMKKVAEPKPVQLVFEFQSKGAPNPRATDLLKGVVTKEVKDTGLFSSVTTGATPGVAMLNVTLNNIPLTDNAAGKGFVTGLTFGLAGSAVTDGYICTVSYLPAGQSTPIVKTARHAIHATFGNANPPPTAQKSASMLDAVNKMTRDVLSNALKDLSYDPAFN